MTSIDNQLSQSFIELITANVGLAPKNFEPTAIAAKLSIRIQALNLSSAEDYYRLLRSTTKASQQEWQRLITLLTNNETYFFRDKEQIRLLRSQILPELIKRKRDQHLRICSAGCSTGEEPYSLAILLKELIPHVNSWQLAIFGIDIDETALQRAKQGIYTPWSFRGVDEAIKQRYFHSIGNQYYLAPEIKQMVKFKTVNLVKDPLPQSTDLKEIDLLICRNVFIYFDSPTIARILEKIYNTLHPLGYFVTGHTELHKQDLSKFHRQFYAESVVYRRQEANLARAKPASIAVNPTVEIRKPRKNKRAALKRFNLKSDPLTKTVQKELKTVSPTNKDKVQNVEKLILDAASHYRQKDYRLAIQKTEKVLLNQPQNIQACHLMAEIHANLGKYEEAIHYCYQALDIDSFFVPAYYLLAQIAEEQGNSEEAKRIYKKVIYLDPNLAIAYLDLSQIYQREGDNTRTLKMQQAALNLLKQLPPETRIEEKDNLTAAELIVQIEGSKLKNG